jgi:hypothetical protein
MFPTYGGKFCSRKTVHNLVEEFSQGCSKVTDDAQPGHPFESATEAAMQWVEQLIRADRRIMIDNVAIALGCSHGLPYSIMHDYLKFQKVCARWLPRELKDREWVCCCNVSHGMQMKEKIGDESKHASMQ